MSAPHEIIEDVLELELLPYQKEFVDEAYKAAKEHKQILYIPPRGCCKYFLTTLQSLAIIMAAQDEGIIRKEIIKK